MCGEIKLSTWSNKSPVTPGSFLPAEANIYIQKGSSLDSEAIKGSEVYWNGFAREETLKVKFNPELWKRGEVIIDSFKEKGRNYDLPQGSSVQAIFCKTESAYQMNIITREGEEKELSVSERWPKTGKRRFTCSKQQKGNSKKKMADQEKTIRVGITGHRPKDVLSEDVYNWNNPKAVQIRKWITEQLLTIKNKAQKEGKELLACSGMALGVDLWFAAVCVKLEIPFIAMVPCKNQDKLWGEKYQELYKKALARAQEIQFTFDGEYSGPKNMLDRNVFMANWLAEKDDSVLLSVHIQGKKGGTSHMIGQANKLGVKNINLDPKKE